MSKKSNKRPWRKLLKKLQRKRRRKVLAVQRDKKLEDAETQKLQDPLYKSWLEQQAIVEKQKEQEEEIERQEQEERWLRRELLAQKQFKKDELKRKLVEAKEEADRLKQEAELRLKETARENTRKEIKLQAEKAAKEFDEIMTNMQTYLDDPTLETPTRLLINVESRPGEKLCEFFEKTNCCRFDPCCSFNHKRPILAKIIIIKHFFQHPLLELQEHEEYSRSDSELELSERDLREAYDEFCKDVWPVLEEFGRILNFRTVRNVHAHLRGHVFVEYIEKRSALKAFINLQNRYYASKRLNVEFSNIKQWQKAVCGLSLGRKCTKGDKCNYLHLIKNVNNKYNQPIHNEERSSRRVSLSTQAVLETPTTSWNAESRKRSRDWRWSESPETEIKNNAQHLENKNDTPATSNSLQGKHTQCGSISSSPYLVNYKKPDSPSRNTYHDESIEYKKYSPINSLGRSNSSSSNNRSSRKSGSSSHYKSKNLKRYHNSEYNSPKTEKKYSKADKPKVPESLKSYEHNSSETDTKYSRPRKSNSHKSSKSSQHNSSGTDTQYSKQEKVKANQNSKSREYNSSETVTMYSKPEKTKSHKSSKSSSKKQKSSHKESYSQVSSTHKKVKKSKSKSHKKRERSSSSNKDKSPCH